MTLPPIKFNAERVDGCIAGCQRFRLGAHHWRATKDVAMQAVLCHAGSGLTMSFKSSDSSFLLFCLFVHISGEFSLLEMRLGFQDWKVAHVHNQAAVNGFT